MTRLLQKNTLIRSHSFVRLGEKTRFYQASKSELYGLVQETRQTELHYFTHAHLIVKITKGEDQYYVSKNESTFIPLGTVDSLENPGGIPVDMIEI